MTVNIWKSYKCTVVEETNMGDPRSYEHYKTSSWNKAWKRFKPVPTSSVVNMNLLRKLRWICLVHSPFFLTWWAKEQKIKEAKAYILLPENSLSVVTQPLFTSFKCSLTIFYAQVINYISTNLSDWYQPKIYADIVQIGLSLFSFVVKSIH